MTQQEIQQIDRVMNMVKSGNVDGAVNLCKGMMVVAKTQLASSIFGDRLNILLHPRKEASENKR